ncbi:hypothetical protein BGZ76_000231 [Entomortierella beljakovae]|nr:hypothetical protein BGZ76_000231 [Entomortierella beljakovae]
MSYDKKKSDWATLSDEQNTFGNQSPFANTSSAPYHDINQPIIPSAPGASGAPSAPGAPFAIPDDAPPMYTKDAPLDSPIQNEVYSPRGMPTPSPRNPQQNSQPQLEPVNQLAPQSSIPQSPQPQNQQHQYQPPTQPPPPQSGPPAVPVQLPSHNPQQYPQQYYPAPVNYGAAPNNGYYPVPRHHDSSSDSDHDDARPLRRRIVFGDEGCHITEDSEWFKTVERVVPSNDLSLKFEALDSLTGNIVVKEADTLDEKDIQIRTLFRASSREILSRLQQSKSVNGDGSVRVWAHINDKIDRDEKKRLMKKGCALAEVQIVYPRDQSVSGKLQLSVANGGIYVMSRPPPTKLDSNMNVAKGNSTHRANTVTFEELKIGLSNGPVTLEYVVILNKLSVSVANGYILGSIDTPGKVSTEIINGSIDLVIDTSSKNYGWDPNKLQVNAGSVNGRIYVSLNRFLGYFSLSSAIGSKNLIKTTTRDVVRYTADTGYSKQGWISEDGQEPINMSQMNLTSVNGIISAVVDN